jgi:hypothetical protein
LTLSLMQSQKIFIHLSRTGVPLVTYPAFERDVLWIST